MLLNILALVVTLGVAYVSAVLGLYRAIQTLVACIVAGILAFGLCGPLANAVGASDPTSIWYFAGDAFFLWAVFCLVFMGLRLAGEKFFQNQPSFPPVINFTGGAIVGLGTGYLSVGVCLLLAQMLPLAPDILGYSPFEFTPAEGEAKYEQLERGQPLWLSWDRGTLAFFGYLSSAPLGSETASFYNRYGDVYPPAYQRPEKYEGVVNDDDVLYFHWYRRYQSVFWRGYWMRSPVPRRMQDATGMGLTLRADTKRVIDDVDIRVLGVQRADTLDGFPTLKPPAGESFLKITLLIKPVGKLPRAIDTTDFLLVNTQGEKLRKPPLVYGATELGEEPKKENMVVLPTAPKTELRNLRFGPGQGAKPGHYLADGAAFEFAAPKDRDLRTLVFTMPESKGFDFLRLLFEPPGAAKPEAAPAAPGATPAPTAPARPAPAKAPVK